MSDGTESPSLPRGKPAFDQDPHRVREITERNLEAAIGREVRNFRRQQGMTVADLANVTGLSIGMLSKIENELMVKHAIRKNPAANGKSDEKPEAPAGKKEKDRPKAQA
jgi:DNA-binding XRE family transcriptional regulator